MVTNIFTVDVEDWYQGLEVIDINSWSGLEDRIWNGLEKILSLLSDFDTRATFFILGYIAEKHPEMVREIHKRGHEIATHGYSHKQVYKMKPDEFREDLQKSLYFLEEVTKEKTFGFRAPIFSITDKSTWALNILVEEGIRYDSSIFPVRNYRYGISNANPLPHFIPVGNKRIFEIPLSVLRYVFNIPFSGGAYARILPYNFIKFGVKNLNKKGVPCNFYIHPWELDPEHPRIKLPYRISLPHYWNLHSTEGKIRKLLSEFRFGSVKEVFGNKIN